MISRFKVFTSPKRWIFVDPDTMYQYVENDKQSLIKRVKAYRSQNNLPDIAAIDTVIENYLCGLPENKGICEKVKLERGWYSYFRGGVSLLSQIFYEKMVDSTTAEARAMQCAGCSLNVFPDKGNFMLWSDAVAESQTGGRKVSIHDKLGSCGGCSCTLKSKVWFGGEIKLTEAERAKMKAAMPTCWQLSNSKQR